MMKSIFIANRGEIALRIIRACKELGIRSVIGYSQADKDSFPVSFADKSICIGPSESTKSYLKQDNIIAAASGNDCDAVHPGVGFLSENAEFAKRVIDEGLIFIGPKQETIRLLGDKISAKKSAVNAHVPIVPGTEEAVDSVQQVADFVKEHGFPIIIKAASGGGGKGMRVVEKDSDFEHALQITSSEAEKSFSDKRVYIEKFLVNPRHVEIQILADSYGNVVHLGERDCTVQMRHQKIIEESPSPAVDQVLRERMGEAAIQLALSIGYENVGTVEFLLDGNDFYFMEVNSRIQVEHPVTELVTGIDLIEWQIRVASGEKLSFSQKDIVHKGYAMECRINALTPGTIENINIPGGMGIRVDTWVTQNTFVTPFYDSLLMKLLVYADDRKKGIQKMLRALEELELSGKALSHNKEMLKKILTNSLFRSSRFNLRFLEESGVLGEKR